MFGVSLVTSGLWFSLLISKLRHKLIALHSTTILVINMELTIPHHAGISSIQLLLLNR